MSRKVQKKAQKKHKKVGKKLRKLIDEIEKSMPPPSQGQQAALVQTDGIGSTPDMATLIIASLAAVTIVALFATVLVHKLA